MSQPINRFSMNPGAEFYAGVSGTPPTMFGAGDLPSRDKARKVVRAILERKYECPPDYVQMVVDSITDDPIRLREPRYVKSRRSLKGEVRAASEPRIALVLNDEHTLHHVQDRGYVEAPVRIRSIMTELDPSGWFASV